MENQEQKKKSRFIGKTGQANTIKTNKKTTPIRRGNEIPKEILNNELLNEMIHELLPKTYKFEIHKTIHQVIDNKIKILGLQVPEGLLQFSLIISDIINKFCSCCEDIIILGDVTYGACCVDDFTAKALGCQMLVHYGHSCLIPVDQTSIKTLYVFVEIGIDKIHLRDTIIKNFPKCLNNEKNQLIEGTGTEKIETKKEEKINNNNNSKLQHISIEHDESSKINQEITLALVGTVQFVSAVQALKHDLEEISHNSMPTISNQKHDNDNDLSIQISNPSPQCHFNVIVPQVKPLSPGEILGCTAPKLPSHVDAIVYIGDGRFHLESIMIANPKIPAYRYDPYSKKLTYEVYDHFQMRNIRNKAIHQASLSLTIDQNTNNDNNNKGQNDDLINPLSSSNLTSWAVVLGTLGRQGSLSVLKSISEGFKLKSNKTPIIPILISELSFEKLIKFENFINVFVQTSCPRLSIDWGEGLIRTSSTTTITKEDGKEEHEDKEIPFLNPYEAKVALGQAPGFKSQRANHDGLLDTYPMDFYADHSLGDWTPRFRNPAPLRSAS